ncbi:hypothetical protein HDU83_001106, partial [Entophlyctis luteolus]
GKLFGCGGTLANVFLPLRLPPVLELCPIVHVACGFAVSLALDGLGRIWAWNSLDSLSAVQIAIPPATAIRASVKQHGAITTDGCVWIWNDLGSPLNSVPHCIHSASDDGDKAVGLALGQWHSLILTKAGQIFSFGSAKRNKYSQLGFSSEESGNAQKNLQPVKHELSFPADNNEIPVDIFSGWSHSAVMMKSGKCFMWGRCDLAQIPALHPDEAKRSFILPQAVPSLQNARFLCLGSETSVAVLEDGTVSSWGWNEHGNCGVGHTSNVQLAASPGKVLRMLNTSEFGVAQKAFCGYGHCFVIFDLPASDQIMSDVFC